MLAVTTRNCLRSVRFCVPMLRARRLIARQLADQPGLIRYASGVASPTEFFTLTVWENRELMQRFMQTGAHQQLMWQFSRWSSSFWGARWEPAATSDEIGDWAGLRLANLDVDARQPSPLVVAGLLSPSVPRAGPLGPRPETSAVEPRQSGIFVLTARFEGPLPSIRARWPSPPNNARLRRGVGLDWSPQALSISLWQDRPRVRGRALGEARADGASWAMCWEPADYEIGHWDHLRLRQAARSRRPRVDPDQRPALQ